MNPCLPRFIVEAEKRREGNQASSRESMTSVSPSVKRTAMSPLENCARELSNVCALKIPIGGFEVASS